MSIQDRQITPDYEPELETIETIEKPEIDDLLEFEGYEVEIVTYGNYHFSGTLKDVDDLFKDFFVDNITFQIHDIQRIDIFEKLEL